MTATCQEIEPGVFVQDRCFEGREIAAGGVVVDRLGPDDAD